MDNKGNHPKLALCQIALFQIYPDSLPTDFSSIHGSQALGRFPWPRPAGLAGGRAYSAGRRGGR